MRVYCHCQPPRLLRLKPCVANATRLRFELVAALSGFCAYFLGVAEFDQAVMALGVLFNGIKSFGDFQQLPE